MRVRVQLDPHEIQAVLDADSTLAVLAPRMVERFNAALARLRRCPRCSITVDGSHRCPHGRRCVHPASCKECILQSAATTDGNSSALPVRPGHGI